MAALRKYLGLITGQHRDKPRFVASITAFAQPSADQQATLAGLPAAFDLDQAVGAQLDAIGLWVGRSRIIATPLAGVYFSWDTEGLGWDQGVWQGQFDPSAGPVSLDDETYRLLLRAKIAANAWDGTLPGARDVLAKVFTDPETHVFVQDNFDMTMSLCVAGKIPDPTTLALIIGGYIPLKPEGVRQDIAVTTVDRSPLFGFDMDNERVSGFDTGAWGVAA